MNLMKSSSGEPGIRGWTLDTFLQESASSAPTPGGGSAAAYSGALAASMVCMAARLTLGKDGYDEVQELVKEVEEEASERLQGLKEGVEQDIEVFNAYMKALRLPKNTDAEKQQRTEKLRQASYEALLPPLSIAENALGVIKLACRLAPIGNKNVISDVGVAAALAEGALQAALWSVEINLVSLPDRDYVAQVRGRCEGWRATASRQGAEAAAVVSERISE
ncbi:MAG: cyclodeaminase/cyclohydrolase family protein [Peptococcaceae bacterium]|nr:cyclodeaminase/cyclohydrolase family protein [Peptococcaceae bacterium]